MTRTPCAATLTLAAVMLTAQASSPAGHAPVRAQAGADSPRVRMALVGAWHVHTNGFLNRISQLNPGQVEWVAVWDQDAARGAKFAERLGVPYERDYER